ncbi:tetratricopeptide repeat protein [Nonomuraea insulae]|uniref:Tetratricopeptide repeat protein n=1 Tax=Nonomuraea insulae TaxID=1616787 RepID=A0ABW1CYT8_9ACTN
MPETTLGLHGNLVSCYRRLGRHDQALASLEEGLALVRARDLPTHEARYLAMRGQIYFDLQRFEESVAALQESLARWAAPPATSATLRSAWSTRASPCCSCANSTSSPRRTRPALASLHVEQSIPDVLVT